MRINSTQLSSLFVKNAVSSSQVAGLLVVMHPEFIQEKALLIEGKSKEERSEFLRGNCLP
jgi:hypothetical protein